MQDFAARLFMAAITIPISYVAARGFLRVFVRVVNGRSRRNVL